MVLFNVAILLGAYAGYRIVEVVRAREPDPGSSEDQADEPEPEADPDHEERIGAGVAAMGLSASASLGLAVPFAAPASLLLTVWATVPMLRRAERSLGRFDIDNDVLSSVVSLTTLGLGRLFAAGLQAGAYHLGQLMVLRAKNAAEASVLDVIVEPEAVWRRQGEAVVSCPLEDIEFGDLVVVSAGEVIPVDGRIVDGHASVDERALTGESAPADKDVGDEVFAAALVLSGRIDVEVRRSGAETTAAQVAMLLEQTASYKSQIQLQGERWSDRVAAPMLVLSALSVPLIGASSAVGLLFAVPSNALRATGSLQTASHLSAISHGGVLVRDGRGLEALEHVDTVLFDKTGTLTEDAFDFAGLRSLGSLNEAELLRLAAALDRRMSHPIAQAIVAEASGRQLDLPLVDEIAVVLGGGVHGRIEEHEVHLGSLRFIRHQDIRVDEAWVEAFTADNVACTNVFVAVDGRLEGALALQPRIRPEARQVIARLRELGVRDVAIVSGDAAAPTRAVAEALQLDDWFANVLPRDKAKIVAKLQAEGRTVCFVGDGINDTLAMKQANTSVSLAGAAGLATDTAQLVLLDGSLRALPQVMVESRELHDGHKITLGFWGVYAVGAMVGAGLLGAGVVTTTVAYASALGTSSLYSAWPLLRATAADEDEVVVAARPA